MFRVQNYMFLVTRGRGFPRTPPTRGDLFRSRPPNTSRPPSLHVDDFLALETCGAQPTHPTGYNKLARDMIGIRGTRGGRSRGYGSERGRLLSGGPASGGYRQTYEFLFFIFDFVIVLPLKCFTEIDEQIHHQRGKVMAALIQHRRQHIFELPHLNRLVHIFKRIISNNILAADHSNEAG